MAGEAVWISAMTEVVAVRPGEERRHEYVWAQLVESVRTTSAST